MHHHRNQWEYKAFKHLTSLELKKRGKKSHFCVNREGQQKEPMFPKCPGFCANTLQQLTSASGMLSEGSFALETQRTIVFRNLPVERRLSAESVHIENEGGTSRDCIFTPRCSLTHRQIGQSQCSVRRMRRYLHAKVTSSRPKRIHPHLRRFFLEWRHHETEAILPLQRAEGQRTGFVKCHALSPSLPFFFQARGRTSDGDVFFETRHQRRASLLCCLCRSVKPLFVSRC